MRENLYFDYIREKRDSYFVEYQPPIADNPFATLNLIFPNAVLWERVSEFLDEEVRYWIERYRVPLIVLALDDKKDIIRAADRGSGCLVAWADSENGEIVQSWNHDNLSDFLKKVPRHPDWRTIYTDIPVRMDAEVKAAARSTLLKRKRENRLLKIFLTLWLAVIPGGYVVFEFFGAEWLALVGLLYALCKALRTSLRIWSRTKPSAREIKESEKKRKMNHYFYHCERNPDGFLRLKVENFKNSTRERVREEADEVN